LVLFFKKELLSFFALDATGAPQKKLADAAIARCDTAPAPVLELARRLPVALPKPALPYW
jgi:hypothetical protein